MIPGDVHQADGTALAARNRKRASELFAVEATSSQVPQCQRLSAASSSDSELVLSNNQGRSLLWFSPSNKVVEMRNWLERERSLSGGHPQL
jgi:hypothetical protein